MVKPCERSTFRDGGSSVKILDETTMRAAEAILAQGSVIRVLYLKDSGDTLECFLSGYGEDGETALLTLQVGEQLHHKAAPYHRVLLDDSEALGLDRVARTQRRQQIIDQAKALRAQQLDREAVAA
jgi:hypothetical protein